jgi:tripartite ATP-independent transporter DctM subunit
MLVIMLIALLALLLLGVPIFAALGLASLLYIQLAGIPPLIVIQQMFNGIDQFALLAVPFFILAGILMNSARITDEIFGFARAMVGHLPGGMGHVNITASVIFSGMSGTAVADAGGLGTVEIKAMRDQGYPASFAIGITAASSTIGPIIPPSLAMIVYGVSSNESIGQLFAAGIVPGMMMAIALHVMVWRMSVRHGYPREPRTNWGEALASLRTSFPALVTPIIIIGGILAGIFTPTEAAVVAVIYAVVIGMFWYRALSIRSLLHGLLETFETTAIVMLMVSASAVFGWILVRENIASAFSESILSLASEPWQALLLLNIILLVAGMFMETVAIILILTPIFMPVLASFGIDGVQFGIIMVLNLMVGLITPPIGLLLFVMARIADAELSTVIRACLPFMIPLVIVLVLITLIPELTLTVPSLIYGD